MLFSGRNFERGFPFSEARGVYCDIDGGQQGASYYYRGLASDDVSWGKSDARRIFQRSQFE